MLTTRQRAVVMSALTVPTLEFNEIESDSPELREAMAQHDAAIDVYALWMKVGQWNTLLCMAV